MQTLDQNQPTPPSLNEVNAKFEQWRSTRPSKRSKIPDPLWQLVLTLLNKHPIGEISQALRLSGGQIKAKMQLYTTNATINTNKPSDFVSITIPQATEEIDTSFSGKVEIKRPDGAAISIERLNQKTLVQFLTQFMQGL